MLVEQARAELDFSAVVSKQRSGRRRQPENDVLRRDKIKINIKMEIKLYHTVSEGEFFFCEFLCIYRLPANVGVRFGSGPYPSVLPCVFMCFVPS